MQDGFEGMPVVGTSGWQYKHWDRRFYAASLGWAGGLEMIVEWRRMRVRSELVQRFLKADEAVWTAGLAREEGFLGKEVWLDRREPGEVVLVIRWRSERDWTSIPGERLEELERRFREHLPEGHELVEMRVFEVEMDGDPDPVP